MNQVSKIIIIIKKKYKIKKNGGDGREGDSVEERYFYFIFSFFRFFFRFMEIES